ncbi:hypothetical protein OEG79_18870 [Pseudomonas sp. Z8(2022)]|jgi:hypothetical protein|uniref:hypothetical protein n=1 Tax=Pseudomonas sp. Z8(2022) TaxID=2962597 RepID=UPI0021F48074|nr:hypothetical protein [Pseudomonas sp. Z8(2022)]UYP30091.1 hypothetical protein OEG79_18870 [Pseudomonas sp. Z8(2022)]
MSKHQHPGRRSARNRLERWIQAVANLPEGHKFLLLPFLPAWLAPASWSLWGTGAGALGICTCVAVALFSIRRNERTLDALLYNSDARSITRLFFNHLAQGLGLSIALFLPHLLFTGR